ncbi:MAG: tetratricopeptide repeat protein [Chloroflexota bacterium]|nr:tetratricopeptide repeat protein [Chloroflexota bacterium]
MESLNPDSTQPRDFAEVLEVITEIISKSAEGNYVYRGEREPYQKVSSSLYRLYADINVDHFDIEFVQAEILAQARQYTRYTGESDDLEILSQLQHNGGATNLIDFTTDYLIALFFACDGEPNKTGRVILLSETGEGYRIEEPRIPVHRVIAQKSVFVRPDVGFVEPDDECIVTIDSKLKPQILEYLRSHHGISAETIYNDLHGFITHQGIHQSAYTEFHKGMTSAHNEDNQKAIEHYTSAINLNPQMGAAYNNRGNAYYDLGDFRSAIDDYNVASSLDPEVSAVHYNLGNVYAKQGNYRSAARHFTRSLELEQDDSNNTRYRRAEAWLNLGEWEMARQDLVNATQNGVNVSELFCNDYQNIDNFEQQTGLTMPEDIGKMLSG